MSGYGSQLNAPVVPVVLVPPGPPARGAGGSGRGVQQQQRMYIIIGTCQLTSVREVKLCRLTVENTATNVTNGSDRVKVIQSHVLAVSGKAIRY